MPSNFELTKFLSSQSDEIQKLKIEKNNAYTERNRLVALLSKVFPSELGRHDPQDLTWEKDWFNIVYVNLPTGQCSWHIHDSELYLFSHLKLNLNVKWDGHSTEEKYKRIEDYRTLHIGPGVMTTELEESNTSNFRVTC